MENKMNNDAIYANIAQALARGYTDLYYVNIETDELIEYHTDDERGVLSEARRSSDFFEGCVRDVKLYVHPDDHKVFLEAMDPVFLTKALEKSRIFEFTYRRIKDGRSFYVTMRVTRVESDKRFIVIAVSDVDELIKKRQAEKRIEEERTIYARLHALTGNFICVYVINTETDHYREFSATDDYTESFAQDKEGECFFDKVRTESRQFNYPDDVDYFLTNFTKEKIMAEIGRKGVYTLNYRLLMDSRPYYVQMKAVILEEKEGLRLIVGLIDIDAQVRQRLIDEEIARQKEIYDQITGSLAEQYDTLYYIDIEDSTYAEISSTDEFKKLNVPATGNDFFAESRRSIRKYVHPEDQDKALRLHYKDVMIANLKNHSSFSLAWRLVVNGKVVNIRHTELMSRDGKHIIVCIENIDAEVKAELELKENQKKSVTYTQIAERLADHYDLIYYIDCRNSNYIELSTKQKSGELNVQSEGDDFFGAAARNVDRFIYLEDRSRIRLFMDRDNLLTRLENRRQLTEDYRMITADGKIQYTRMSVVYSSDHSHFIICVENRDEDVRREKEHLEELSIANRIARRDELTHTKNKTAYHEMENELQSRIGSGCEPFGIVVCDINDLKIINDTEGHKAGDDYIKASCTMICRTFSHSPVFRIGGDEFAVVLRGDDYKNRMMLISGLRRQAEENVRIGEGPVVASGLAEYQPEADHFVEDVFNRADRMMYDNKTQLKEQKKLQESRSFRENVNIMLISDDRRTMLDTLYKAFEVVSEGTYVFLCDMKYDFSRWSKNAVDHFGLPSEYMYGAGDIWENCIHPDDRAAYHKGIDELFSGNLAGHDMQYRAMCVNGEYDVCTCRGVVIRDPSGEPDYFVGNIRNHSLQGHVDTLTGIKNQYGFFDDLDSYINRRTRFSVLLFCISRFSEINEMYDYHFGNRVLQQYARELLERAPDSGHIYRIDGPKFALISTLTVEELQSMYDQFRAFLHEEFKVDGRTVLIDLHCGAVRVDSFDIDSQTVYACLNYADEESKLRRQGNMTEFHNDLNENNHQRLETLHAIRASIMHDCEGFYLMYQPVVDAKTESLIGAEALLRWKKDCYGTVPPDMFIPILESDPLFPELGEWILRESILAAKQILEKYPWFVINVNLSYTQLEKPNFVDMVLRILNELEYPPEHLCLEVTERCRLLDIRLLKNVVSDLKEKGILIALDDFGTGYSSLGTLKEIPFNIIKIDRSFVEMIEENEIDRKLVGNIADLASIFRAKVCVEGIETGGMREILMNYNVESFQGYYYAKPLELGKFLELDSFASDKNK